MTGIKNIAIVDTPKKIMAKTILRSVNNVIHFIRRNVMLQKTFVISLLYSLFFALSLFQ